MQTPSPAYDATLLLSRELDVFMEQNPVWRNSRSRDALGALISSTAYLAASIDVSDGDRKMSAKAIGALAHVIEGIHAAVDRVKAALE